MVPLFNLATAEGAYDKLTVPVFGSGVVYDVPNAILMEQKKYLVILFRFIKDCLTMSAFQTYIPKIFEECRQFINELKHLDKLHLFEEMSELTIRTAANCLMGKEIRSQLHSDGFSL
jgi:cytochrome P450